MAEQLKETNQDDKLHRLDEKQTNGVDTDKENVADNYLDSNGTDIANYLKDNQVLPTMEFYSSKLEPETDSNDGDIPSFENRLDNIEEEEELDESESKNLSHLDTPPPSENNSFENNDTPTNIQDDKLISPETNEDKENEPEEINTAHETSYNEETEYKGEDVVETTKTKKECTVTDKSKVLELEDGSKVLSERTETVKTVTISKTIEGTLPEDYVPEYPKEHFSKEFPFTPKATPCKNSDETNHDNNEKETKSDITDTAGVEKSDEIEQQLPSTKNEKPKKKTNIITKILRRISNKDKKKPNVIHKTQMAEFEFPLDIERVESCQMSSESLSKKDKSKKKRIFNGSKGSWNVEHEEGAGIIEETNGHNENKKGSMFRKFSFKKHRVQSMEKVEFKPLENKNDFMVVVAIDFGTAFSGYAFSFVNEDNTIHMMRQVGDPGILNHKCPTILLLDSKKEFHSFGYSARDFYHNLDPNIAAKWYYFDKFKMDLYYEENLNLETEIEATNGQKVKAIDVFMHSLKFFKEHVISELTESSLTNFETTDIRWVITVPAIWKAEAKQFMRHAANLAGISTEEDESSLLIALEPEVASIYCRKLRFNQLIPDKPSNSLLSTPTRKKETFVRKFYDENAAGDSELVMVEPNGERYVVIDCGGGTVDITVHEMEANCSYLKELYKAVGGPYGSTSVDNEFLKLLSEIFGGEFLRYYKCKRPAGFIDLMISFESRKRAASPFKENFLNIPLPFSFIVLFKSFALDNKLPTVNVENAVFNYNNPSITIVEGMLRITQECMMKLFQPTIEKISEIMEHILDVPELQDIKYLFLVGGFAESAILQNHLRKKFSSKRLIIPQDIGLTILKGAVCYGLDPFIVKVRVCRQTYGVGILNKWHAGHPESKKVSRDGVDYCLDVFDKFVLCGQSIGLGECIIRRYQPAITGQNECILNFYSSDSKDVGFITDQGVEHCGCLKLFLQGDGEITSGTREIQVGMVFGDTEVKVYAIDLLTNKCIKAKIDFLNS